MLRRHGRNVVIVGEGRQRRARVLDIIATFGRDEQATADWLRGLFERSHFQGYAQSRPDSCRSGRQQDIHISERSCCARRRLASVKEGLSKKSWCVLWFRLFFEESDVVVAVRVGCRRQSVRTLLMAALKEASELRHGATGASG